MKAYDDIISLGRWEPRRHRRMAVENRAAQFAPFAALEGYDAAICETGRLTQAPIELDSERMRVLNDKLSVLLAVLPTHPVVEVTYYVPDERKAGGAYRTHRGRVRRMDDCDTVMIFADGKHISLRDINDMRSPIFAVHGVAG